MSPEEQARAMLGAECARINYLDTARAVREADDTSSIVVPADAAVRALTKALSREEQVRAEIRTLKHEIAKKDRALHARNVALDGMAWVWCNGGCQGGVFRFADTELTDEMLALIERNTERLKQWAKNRDYRSAAAIRSAPSSQRGD